MVSVASGKVVGWELLGRLSPAASPDGGRGARKSGGASEGTKLGHWEMNEKYVLYRFFVVVLVP